MRRWATDCESRDEHFWPREHHKQSGIVASMLYGLKEDQFEILIVGEMGTVRYSLRTGQADML